jgi:DNA polymerase I-like protein with 3'-5' exonuclease and polymerase domains
MQPRRFTHYLKTNAKTEMPSRILFVDTEANIKKLDNGRIEQTLRLGCAIYYRMYRDRCGDYKPLKPDEYTFKTIDEFYNILDKLVKDDSKLIVIAHNMAYDYTILKIDSYLSSRAYEIVLRSISSAFIVNATNGTKTLSLISSTNYYRMSLEKLGEIFGFPKTKVDFEKVEDKELEEYCKNDTRVLAKVMIEHLKFVEKNDLGNFKTTVASQAFACFRHLNP